MMTIPEILKAEAEQLSEELKQAIIDNRQDATGRTRSMIASESGDEFLEVLGPHWLLQLQQGRGPTQNSGDGSVYERILEWVRAKGVIFQDGIQNSMYTIEERTAKTITFLIHRQGTYHFRMGKTFSGETNPILQVFSPERIQAIAAQLGETRVFEITSEIFEGFQQLNHPQP